MTTVEPLPSLPLEAEQPERTIAPEDAAEMLRDQSMLRSLLVEMLPGHVGGEAAPSPFLVGQPSFGRYRHEDYGWDPAFFVHSLLAVGDAETALGMMDAMAWKVEQAGFLPLVTRWSSEDHNLLWRFRARADRRFSHETHPPMLAQTALHLVRELGLERVGGADRVRRHASAAQRNVDWLFANRVAEGRRLISVIDPIETGMDSLIAWDEYLGRRLPPSPLREFAIHHASFFLSARYVALGWDLKRIYASPSSALIEPVSFNVLVARELLALQVLWSLAGETGLAWEAGEQVQKHLAHLEDDLWSEEAGAYLPAARYGRSDWRRLRQLSVDALYPLLLPDLPADRVERLVRLVAATLDDGYPVDVSLRSGPARPARSGLKPRLWGAGQVWANTNLFVREGLRHHATRVEEPLAAAMEASAARIDADWKTLKDALGYHEYYNQDGTGGGEAHFFWDCLRRARFTVACGPS